MLRNQYPRILPTLYVQCADSREARFAFRMNQDTSLQKKNGLDLSALPVKKSSALVTNSYGTNRNMVNRSRLQLLSLDSAKVAALYVYLAKKFRLQYREVKTVIASFPSRNSNRHVALLLYTCS